MDAGGIRTYFEHKGTDHPQAVVLLHGLGASSFSFRHNVDPLAEHFAVYAPDFKGFGASAKPVSGYGLADLREQICAFLDAVGLERVVLVGSSMGGEVAIRLALEEPERVAALVLIDSAGFLERRDTPLQMRLLTGTPVVAEILTAPIPFQIALGRPIMARYLRRLYYDPTHVTPDVVEGYYRPMAHFSGSRGLLARMRARDWGMVADRIREIRVPTLVLWGEADPLIPVEHAHRFGEAIPHAQIITYSNAGHDPHAEIPDQVNRDIIAFITSLSEPPVRRRLPRPDVHASPPERRGVERRARDSRAVRAGHQG